MRLSQFVRLAAPGVNAPKSAKGKPGMVKVPGRGSLYAEPPDTDDTFPPMIASYEVIDGWLIYEGRNGSEGIIVGPPAALDKWVADVERELKLNPVRTSEVVEWTPTHGGSQHVKRAKDAAKKAGKVLGVGSIAVEVWVAPGARQEGEASVGGRGLKLTNVHEGGTVEYHGPLQGIKLPTGAQIAAHEVAHSAFSKNAAKGKKAVQALKEWVQANRKYITMYHSLSGSHLEGLMDLASLYVNAPTKLKAKAPELYKVIEDWVS